MDELNQQAEVVETPVESAVETPTPEFIDSDSAGGEQVEYTPNLKYKVLDKELEFDPEFKDFVKSKIHEEKLRDLYTKAAGLDPIKQDREKYRTESQKYQADFQNVMKVVQPIDHFLKNKDLDNAFKAMNVEEKQVFEWALKKLEARDLPQAAQQQYNQATELQRQNYFMQQQLQEIQQSQIQQTHAHVRAEYDQVINQPEINSFVSAFEQRNGAGAFTQEVQMRGLAYYQRNGRDASPKEIVGEIISRFNIPVSGQNIQSQTVVPQQHNNMPVIPVAKSSSTSVVSKKPQSLKALREELVARNNS